MIALTQIKAARALLGWTQEHLAQAAGLSLPAINNLERGLTTPRRDTLLAIETALQDAGIDFIDQTGVRLRPPELDVTLIDGPDWLKKYDEMIITHMQAPEDEICQFSCDEHLWIVHGSTSNHHYIDHRNKIGFKERILVPETARFVTNLRNVYRCAPATLFGDTSWQVFGPYVAQILWKRQQILLTRSAPLAGTQRRLFDALWDMGSPFTAAQWKRLEKWNAPKK